MCISDRRSCREIDEEQRSAPLLQQVAEGVEIVVAGEVGDGERVAVDADEAGTAAAMRDVGAAGFCLKRRGAGDEQRVGLSDLRAGLCIQTRQAGGWRGDLFSILSPIADLDVLRAVAEALRDLNREPICRNGLDPAIRPIAATCLQFEPEQADGAVRPERSERRVGFGWQGRDGQCGRGRALDEACLLYTSRCV